MKARILLIEDSAEQGKQTLAALDKIGYETLWAQGGLPGLKLAQTERPDLILLDVVMDDMDGYGVCRWLKLQEATRDIPVIMLTVRAEVGDRVEGLHVGADDYLPKPFDQRELEARIFAALRTRAMRSELQKRAEDLEGLLSRVEIMAMSDPLTGLFNRRRFTDVLRREFATARRYGNALSCLMIDLDHFKKINDRFGHEVGDQVLKAFATVIASDLREVDVPVRYGGEEFAVLLPQTNKAGAHIVAQRIVDRSAAQRYEASDGQRIELTISVGVAGIEDVKSGNEEELVIFADSALYQAKIEGRDRIVSYSPNRPTAPGKS